MSAMLDNFDYYQVNFRLRTPQIGTGTTMSIYQTHVLEKAKKEIAKANRLKEKTTKSLDKYKGSTITPDKELRELQGVMRSYMQTLGKGLDVPATIEDLLNAIVPLEEEWADKLKKNELMNATVFLRGKDGLPLLGTHMILGNIKENIKIMVNSGNKTILPSKVSVGETCALDIKAVEQFMKPTKDIYRAASKEDYEAMLIDMPILGSSKWVYEEETGRVLCERPIKFDRMGQTETAIAISEALPTGTEFSTVLRVRKDSKFSEEALRDLFDLGKSNGFGAWRGSGNAGAYEYQLKKLGDYKEQITEGWS